MPGVFRSYTLVDILGTINGGLQDATQGTTTITGTSLIAEADESATMSDTVVGTLTTNQGWDQVTWGTFSWG